MKRTWIFITLLTLLAALLGGVRWFVVPTYFPHLLKPVVAQDQSALVVSPSPESISDAAQENEEDEVATVLLQKLNPRQKVAQVIAFPVSVAATNSAQLRTAELSEVPGLFTLTGREVTALNAEKTIAYLDNLSLSAKIAESLPQLSEEERLLLKPLIAVDHEGGTVQRLRGEGLTVLPSAAEQCKMNKAELLSLLQRTAKELSGVGIDIVYAPVIDVAANHPVLKTRICSDDSSVVRDFGEYWIVTLQAEGITPVVKHYPGIGQTKKDLHLAPDKIEFNPIEHSLFVALLTKYQQAGVMSSHVVVTDSSQEKVLDTGGLPCTVTTSCLEYLPQSDHQLRFTDALEMVSAKGFVASSAASTDTSLEMLARKSLVSGHTVLVFDSSVQPQSIDRVIATLADEYQRSPEFRQQIDQAVLKIWRKKHSQQNTQ